MCYSIEDAEIDEDTGELRWQISSADAPASSRR
jgi:hypothetical protein